MDVRDKVLARYRLALTIQKIIADNSAANQEDGVTSLRKLAAASDTEYSIIQKITSTKKDPQFSTIAAIIDGFGFSFSGFFAIYDAVTREEIDGFKRELKEKKKQKVEKAKRTPLKKDIKKKKG
jgi:hypothetical protein